MRRSVVVGVALAVVVTATTEAHAQDDADAGSPPPTPAPAPTLTPTPTPTLTPTPTPTPTSASTSITEEDAPERLAAVIGIAAKNEQRARVVDAVLGLVLAAGTTTSGTLLVTLPTRLDAGGHDLNAPSKAIGGIAIGFGVLSVLTSGLGLVSAGPLERLDVAYGPIARDRAIPAADRLAQGESTLRAMAEAGRRGRIFGGIVSIVLGVGLGVAAIPIVASIPDTQDNTSTRVYLGLAMGISSFASIAGGVTGIVVRRTEAEQLWSTWLAGTGRANEARLTPFFTPIVGGAVAGIGARY